MAFLPDDPKNPQKGEFGLLQTELLSSQSPAVAAIADDVVLRRSLKNPSLFEIIVDRYQDGFLRSAYRVVRSKEDAEDIVQNAFVKIYKNGAKYKKQPGASFKSWAYRILMNTAFTHYRKLKKKDVNLEEFFDVILYEEAGEKDKSLHHKLENKDEVERALNSIPTELAELLRLHYFKGYSYEDISNKKGLSISTLKMRLYRARKMVEKNIS